LQILLLAASVVALASWPLAPPVVPPPPVHALR
jgi:hypothetical protein